jgi:hypothetical protein
VRDDPDAADAEPDELVDAVIGMDGEEDESEVEV